MRREKFNRNSPCPDSSRPSAEWWAENAAGLNLKRNGSQLEGPCPLCGGKDRFHVNTDADALAGCRKCDLADWPGFLRAIGWKANGHASGAARVRRWEYRTTCGKSVVFARRDGPDGKRPWFEPAGIKPDKGERWLPLGELPEGPVVVCEGEATCDAIREAGFTATTWWGGDKQWKLTEWKGLAGREVTLWPDNDAGGIMAMHGIAAVLGDRHGCAVRWVQIPADKPAKWDAADTHADEIRTLIESASDKPLSMPESEAAKAKAKARRAAADGEIPEGHKQVHYSGRKNVHALEFALKQFDIRVRWNVRGARIEWREGDAGAWKELRDRKLAAWRTQFEDRITFGEHRTPLSISRYAMEDGLLSIVGRQGDVDPFRVYLDSQPEWDGKPRLAGLIETLFDVPEGYRELAAWAGTYIFAGAVNRTLHPGAKQDNSPVFIGGKGIGKSTLTRAIFPPEFAGDWHTDGFSLSGRAKEQVEAIEGKVLCEISEMSGADRVFSHDWKTVMTSTFDNSVRKAYARCPEKLPRMCIFAGTADREDCLPNDDNLRRFVPVRLIAKSKGGNEYARIVEAMGRYREQLWAEALHMVRNGYNPILPDELKPAAELAAENARITDSLVSDPYAKHGELLEGKAREMGGMTLSEIGTELSLIDEGGVTTAFRQKSLRTELRANGWTTRRVRRGGGKPLRLWFPPA